jgi:methionine-rich copper-binding protein CopC
MRIATALLFIGLCLLAARPSIVLAHARPEVAEPAPDSTIAGLSEVRIWFTQELTLRGNDIVITDSVGNRVDNGDAYVDQTDPNRKLLVATVQPLADGVYTLTWTSSSAEDGHPGTDSYTFSVQTAPAEPALVEPVPGAAVRGDCPLQGSTS